jgi:hypothetical protein
MTAHKNMKEILLRSPVTAHHFYVFKYLWPIIFLCTNFREGKKDKFIYHFICMLNSWNFSSILFMPSMICWPSGIFKCYLVYKLYHFLALQWLNFNQLLLHDLGQNVGYDSLHHISNSHKNLHKIWPPRIVSCNFLVFFKSTQPLIHHGMCITCRPNYQRRRKFWRCWCSTSIK